MDIAASLYPDFRVNISKLSRKARGKDLTTVVTKSTQKTCWQEHQPSWLPFRTERKLAKDFAFLAAWKESPSCVSAATLSRDEVSETTILCVAANHEISQFAKETLATLLSLLSRCARYQISRARCARECLEATIRLHRNRILGRLASPLYQKPKDSPRKYKGQALSAQALQQAISALSQAETANQAGNTLLVAQLSFLANRMKALEEAGENARDDHLQQVIIAAYDVYDTGQSFSLSQRLSLCGLSPDLINGRLARQLRTLGNYWRICRYLADVARSDEKFFTHLVLRDVHFGQKNWTVHAEIQLLFHHELHHYSFPPRVIPASKKPCFLCYTFMNAYGGYHVSETHGEIYNNWYLPGSVQVNHLIRMRLTKALRDTAGIVQELCDRFKESPSKFIGNPSGAAQSIISSDLDGHLAPSISTTLNNNEDEDQSHLVSSSKAEHIIGHQYMKSGKDSIRDDAFVTADRGNDRRHTSSSKDSSPEPITLPRNAFSIDNVSSINEVSLTNPSNRIDARHCIFYKIEASKPPPSLSAQPARPFWIENDPSTTSCSESWSTIAQDSTAYIRIGRVWLHLEYESIKRWPTSDALLLASAEWTTSEVLNTYKSEAQSTTVDLDTLCTERSVLIESPCRTTFSLRFKLDGQPDFELRFDDGNQDRLPQHRTTE